MDRLEWVVSDNTEDSLGKCIDGARPLDEKAMRQARSRLLSLVKPPGSLGRLEDIAARLAGITGRVRNRLEKPCLLVFCADNGVVEEGVASAPQSVTFSQTINLVKGITGAGVLAKVCGSDMMIVDVGVRGSLPGDGIVSRRLRGGTSNIAHGPAMSREEALAALGVGIEMAGRAAQEGYDVIGLGEMGIGNTTTSAAVLSVLTGADVSVCTGKGAGLDDRAYRRKQETIRHAIALNKPNSGDPVDVLAKVGGFDIAAMTGAYLEAARRRIPVVVDGLISAVAALAAFRMQPASAGMMFASHASMEPGYRIAVETVGLTPCLQLEMRLGEGSGCPLMFTVMQAACAVMCDMGTFAEGRIDDAYMNRLDPETSFSL